MVFSSGKRFLSEIVIKFYFFYWNKHFDCLVDKIHVLVIGLGSANLAAEHFVVARADLKSTLDLFLINGKRIYCWNHNRTRYFRGQKYYCLDAPWNVFDVEKHLICRSEMLNDDEMEKLFWCYLRKWPSTCWNATNPRKTTAKWAIVYLQLILLSW